MPTLSLLNNVMLPMDVCGLYRRGESEQRAMDLLRMVELEDHAFKLPSAISGVNSNGSLLPAPWRMTTDHRGGRTHWSLRFHNC